MKQLITIFIAISISSLAWAQFQQFRVEDIRVEGNQRVSQATVFAATPINLGDVVTENILRETAGSLMRTGYFDYIEFEQDDNALVIVVTERPAISEITVEGNKALKTEELLKNMSDNGLAEGQIFQQAVLDGMSQAVRQSYISQGRYNATLETEVVELPRNQVKLNILIDEGKEARIKHINIIGNEKFDDETLLELFELTESGWFTWMTGSNKISSEKLQGDLETLESFYLDQGYLDFSILSAPVSISPDKESFYITINLTEGEIYTVDQINLSGELILPEPVIRSLVFLRVGNTFSQTLMTSSDEFITQSLANAGYTFAEVEPVTELNRDAKTVDVTFQIDPGKRAYVRRIEFRGNTKSTDEVLRRTMLQMEGGSASSSQIESSKVQLERTGFFKEVEVETKEVPGTEDQIDVEYTVEEQPSGAIQFTLGYSDFGGSLGASVSNSNWFGTGKQVSFGINYNTYQKNVSFNYNDPYFTPDGVSRGFSVFFRETNYEDFNVATYSTDQYGASVSFGYPTSLIENLGISFGYSNIKASVGQYAVQEILSSPRLIPGVPTRYVTDTFLSGSQELNDILSSVDTTDPNYNTLPISDALTNFVNFNPGDPVDPNAYDGFIDLHGNQFDLFTTTLSWSQSTLNRGASGLSTRGYQQRASLEIALPGGDLEYYKFIYTGQYFKPLTRSLTLRLRTRLGYAGAYGDTLDVPFFEHFYAGGFGSVRGFDSNSLGPRSSSPFYYSTTGQPADVALVLPVDSDGDGFVDGIDTSADGSGLSYISCESCTGAAANKLRNRPLFFDDDPFGGNVLIETSAEILFPLPFIKDQRSVQSAFFIDAGSVFDTECGSRQLNCHDIGWEGMSASYGIGVTWISGFGPLTFSVSRPIQEQEFDEVEFFDFTLGTQF